MFSLRYLAVSLLIALLTFSSLDARLAKRRPASERSCTTNSECLQKGLPPLPPRRRRASSKRARVPVDKRQSGQVIISISSTCGRAGTAPISPGLYRVEIKGAAGAEGGRNFGGNGAAFTATLDITKNLTLGYIVGCKPPSPVSRGAAGGGGTFLYLDGSSQPAIVVAGGGGGGGYERNGPGRPGGVALDGTATLSDGTPGATGGAGGSASTAILSSAGGGGGFRTAGVSVRTTTGTTVVSGGGSQSINFGGTFAGGTPGNGGTGGGGGGAFSGGGGGGGYSGGSGGVGTAGAINSGGGGGGSFAGSVDGITVTPGTVSSTVTTQGSLVLFRI